MDNNEKVILLKEVEEWEERIINEEDDFEASFLVADAVETFIKVDMEISKKLSDEIIDHNGDRETFNAIIKKYVKNLNDIKYFNALKIDLKIEKNKYILNRNNIELNRLIAEYDKLCENERFLRDNLSRVTIELYQLKSQLNLLILHE